MSELVGSLAAVVLLAAAALKAVDRPGASAALTTYGLAGIRADAAWAAAVAAETAIALAVLAGVPGAAWAGAGLLAAFAALQSWALADGRAGAPCGCFGARGGLTAGSLARTLALAGAFAWLAASGAAVSPWWLLAAGAGAAAVVMSERLGLLAPRGALSVAGEGPEPGERLGLPDVAVFTSPGCRLCTRLLRGAGDGVAVFAEGSPEWEAARVPGAPFVVVSRDGVVATRGTANTGPQLRSLVAEAERARLESQVPAALAEATPTRRTLLAQAATLAAAAVGATALVRPGEAEAYHFCGHIYTTDSCPHPTGLPRIDARGFPIRARDGKRVDDLGRPVDDDGAPLDEDGRVLTDAEGRPLPPAPRTRVCTATARQYGFKGYVDGAWYRCCKGQVRKLVDCCTTGTKRINGDKALAGYCYSGRKVFCVMYYDTKVPCDSKKGRRMRRG
jgi:hypothetical protein